MAHAVGLGHANPQSDPGQLMFPTVQRGACKRFSVDDTNAVDYLYNPTSGHRLPTAEFYYPAGTYDDSDDRVGYKGANWWYGQGCCPFSYNSGMTWSDGTGAAQWFPFVGSRITWQFTRHYNRGVQDIYIDGVHQANYSSDDDNDTAWRTQRTWDVGFGPHVIEVRKANGPGDYTDTDAFIVDILRATAGTHDSFNNGWLIYHGAWTHCNNCGHPSDPTKQPHNRTISWSNTPNDGVTFTFVGSGVRYYYTKAYNRGKVKVIIDGVAQPIIDLYANTPPGSNDHQWQQSTHYPLAYGTHQISLVVTGDTSAGNPAYTYIDLDYFLVN